MGPNGCLCTGWLSGPSPDGMKVYLERRVGEHGRRIFILLDAEFPLVLQTVLTVVNGAAGQTVETMAEVAEERVNVVVVGTPSGAVGRCTVVAVSVAAFCLTSTQLQVLLIHLVRYQLKIQTQPSSTRHQQYPLVLCPLQAVSTGKILHIINNPVSIPVSTISFLRHGPIQSHLGLDRTNITQNDTVHSYNMACPFLQPA